MSCFFALIGLSPSSMFGSKQAAIFTICDIHNFIAITEELQEDVMVFVNSIADIVHSMADKYNGLASQNTGDAFLLVWKLDDLYVNFRDDGRIEVIKNKKSQNTADCALISALTPCGQSISILKSLKFQLFEQFFD